MNYRSYLTSLEVTAQYFEDVRIDIAQFTIFKRIREFYYEYIEYIKQVKFLKSKNADRFEVLFVHHTKISKIMLENIEEFITLIEKEAKKLSHDYIPNIDILVSFIHSYRIIQKEIDKKGTFILQSMSESLKQKILSKEIISKEKQLKESMEYVAETLEKLSILKEDVSKKFAEEVLGIFNFHYSLSVPLEYDENTYYETYYKKEKDPYGKLEKIYKDITLICEELFKLLGHKSVLIHSKGPQSISDITWEKDIYSDQFVFIEHINTIYNLSLLHMKLQDCALGVLSDSVSLLKETIACKDISSYFQFKYHFIYLMMKRFAIINNSLKKGKSEEITKELNIIANDKQLHFPLDKQVVLQVTHSQLLGLKGPLSKVQYYELLNKILYTKYEIKIKEHLITIIQILLFFYDEYTISKEDIKRIYDKNHNNFGGIEYNQFVEFPIQHARKIKNLLNRSLQICNELDVQYTTRQEDLLYTRTLSIIEVIKQFQHILRKIIQVHESQGYINTSFYGRKGIINSLKDIDKAIGKYSLFRKKGIFEQEKVLIKLKPLIAQVQFEVSKEDKVLDDKRMSA